MFPDTKNGRRMNTMITTEFFKKIPHLQGFLKIIILKYKFEALGQVISAANNFSMHKQYAMQLDVHDKYCIGQYHTLSVEQSN